ncbi:Serine/threonine-protein kinase CTR1 [Hordeum vulgare]|nr:Serine/threonine-protein kinase CTR1 [Hordeum vulgare]
MAIKKLSRANSQPLLDQVRKLIPAWQREMIQRPGPLILAKSVTSARPIHRLLVLNAPNWVFEEIDKWMKAFFWAGKENTNGGLCLVAWDKVCRPTCLGGIGVRDLRLHAITLRIRWEWLRRTDPSRPWQGIPMVEDKKAKLVFNNMIKITLGYGEQILFWKDRWLHGFTVGEIAPDLWKMVATRTRNRRTVQQALNNNAWTENVVGDINFTMHIQIANLCLAMSTAPRN